MNDTELENLLHSLKPVAPTPDLATRVQHDLDLMASFREANPEPVAVRKRPSQWLTNVVWAGLGAAAAVAVMNLMHGQGVSASSPALASIASVSQSSVLPVTSTREWLDVEDLGISYATPDSPSRSLKLVSMERHQWIDPRDGAEYTVEVPQEESVVLPVQYQ